jgi:hypothetical protein
MRRSRIIALAAAMLGLCSVASLDAWGQPAPVPIPDAAVKRLLMRALENIERAVCDGFNPCTPATPAELESPPISLDEARFALIAGTRTALAGWCGLDANRRSVLPMQQQVRKRGYNNRQVALMGLIHGIQHSIASEQLKARGSCDEATRSRIDAQLPKG